MHILVINWQDIRNPLSGGAEVYLFEIFSRIAKKHKVTLFCSNYKGGKKRESIQGIDIIRKGRRNDFNFVVYKDLKAILRHHRFDIIIDDLNKIPFYTPKRVKIPCLALVMHLFRGSIFRETNLLLGSYVYLTESLIPYLYKSTPFVVLSESSKDDLIKMGIPEEKITVIPPCVDESRYSPDFSKKEENLILHMGRVKRYKCIDHLLYATKILKEKGKDFRVIIGGSGDDLPRLKGLASRLGINDCVEFKGFVSFDEKIELYQRASLLVETSVKEGWGLIVIEANACGTPVVSADSPGLRDSVKDGITGLLYPFGDAFKLAQTIETLLDNREKREELSRNAIKWAGQFSWDRAAERMLKVIERTVDEA